MACENNTTVAPPNQYHFYQNGESPPVCREHVDTGRPHTSIIEHNTLFTKFSVMFFQCNEKKQKNLKLEKNQYLSKSKN